MASKQMENSAMVDRLQKVGKVLQHSEVKTLRSRIDEWLDTNDELLGKLLLFLESGMVTEMLSGQTGRKLPKSCTRVKLLSAAVRCQSLYKANSSLTPSLIRLAKKKDKNIIDKLFSLGASFPTGMAMKGGIPMSEWFQAWSERNQILGSRLQHVSVGSDGAVDWMACGVYFFCRVSESSGVDAGGVEQLCGGEIKDATHVLHKASGMAVSLADLGIPKVEGGWFFEKNWSEESCCLSNGKRIKVTLWDDFKHNEFFKYDSRLTKKFEHSVYFTILGEKVKEERNQKTKGAMELHRAAQDAIKQAGISNTTPLKKRRRCN